MKIALSSVRLLSNAIPNASHDHSPGLKAIGETDRVKEISPPDFSQSGTLEGKTRYKEMI